MASPHEIETMRSMALELQLTAAYDGQVPDRKLLDAIGSDVLKDMAPVICHSPYVYYQDFDPKSKAGYTCTRIDSNPPIGGNFGGFFARTVEVDLLDGETIPVPQVGFFIMDTIYKDVGYICPVESSTLQDVIQVLEDDPIFEELDYTLSQENTDVDELMGTVGKIGRGNPKCGLYAAYIKSIVKPCELYDTVISNGYTFFGVDMQKASAYNEPLNMGIGKKDIFTISGRASQAPELMIRKGRSPSLFVALSDIIGFEPAISE